MSADVLIFVVGGTLAAATAMLFAALGEAVAERAGILNLSVEGMMATGAAAAFGSRSSRANRRKFFRRTDPTDRMPQRGLII